MVASSASTVAQIEFIASSSKYSLSCLLMIKVI